LTEVPRTAAAVERFFDGWDLTAEESDYLARHAPRYALLLSLVGEGRVLDVGANFQTAILRAALGDDQVDALGLWVPRFAPAGEGGHVVFDLNEIDAPEGVPSIGPYGTILVGEVIEHLHRGPATVLRALSSWLAPGGRLVIQTPNAAAAHKRLRLLAGRAPYERMPEDRTGDGHVREYTASELLAAGEEAGLRSPRVISANYFGGSRGRRLAARAQGLVPSGLRLGLTIVWERPPR
jgi:SAM-dependent methyltransferase